MWNKRKLTRIFQTSSERLYTPYTVGAILCLLASGCSTKINRLASSLSSATVIAAPTLAWSPLASSFGNILVGANSSNTIFTLTNSGTANATGCSAPTLSNTTDFTIMTDLCATNDLAYGGATCAVEVRANPGSTGAKTTTLSRTCTEGGTVSTSANLITTTGITVTLAWSPLTKAFGTIANGTNSPPETFTLTNTGTGDATGCSAPSLSDSTNFSIVTDNCTTADVTASGGTCTVDVQANPTSNGAKTATLSRTCTLGGTASTTTNLITTTGVTVTLAWSPLSNAFGGITVGSSSIGSTFTLTNNGTTAASGCSAPSLSNTTDFSITADTCTTADVASGGGTCTVSVRASPLTVGAKTATLSRTCTVGGTVTTTADLITVTGLHRLTFKTQPTNTAAGSSIAPAIEVQAESPVGTVDTTFTSAITLSFVAGTGAGATLAGTLTQSAVLGIAPFSNLSIAKTGNYYKLTAASTGLENATSNSFNISPLTPSQLVFGQSTTNRPVDSCMGPFTVTTQDTLANASAVSSNVTVNLTSNASGVGNFYSTSNCSTGTTTTTISSGTSESSAFYFRNDVGETVTLTADAGGPSGLTAGTKDVTVVARTADTWISNTFTSVPAQRSGASAVWTGTEMIVWGGQVTNGAAGGTFTGGRYNPTTDSWGTATSTTGAPYKRYSHSAVWTGTEMIIWGGSWIGGITNTGGRYNPATDTWGTATTTTGAPAARAAFTAIWTGTEMIVWGGYGAGYVNLNDGSRYNPATDAWGATTSTTGAPSARHGHSAVWTGTEMIIWSGFNWGTMQTSGGRYNPVTDTWGTAPTTTGAPTPRYYHSAVWTGAEMIVWGGANGSWFDTGGRYNPATDTWGTATTTTSAPTARYGHPAVWTGTEMIVWGGSTGSSLLNSGGRYNPATDTWGTATSTSAVPTPREFPAAVWTGTEMIIWGGINSALLNDGIRYNPVTNSWGATTSTVGAPSARYTMAYVWTGTEMIVWGGLEAGSVRANTAGRYNPATNTWGTAPATAGAPTARFATKAIWTGTEMIVWGGADVTPFNDGGRYTPGTDTWGTAPTTVGAPSARYGHTAVWTGTEMIVWGGWEAGSVPVDTGGRYNPVGDSWGTATSTVGAPLGRFSHSAIWTGSEMVVWGGGRYGAHLNSGGRYSPGTDTWGTATSTTNAPVARLGHIAIWTGLEMIIWGGTPDNEASMLDDGAFYIP